MFPKLPITVDLQQTIEQLEGKVDGAPPTSSHLVTTTYGLRKKPLGQFTVGELRIMLGQQLNLEYLLPLALNKVMDEPLVEGDYYPGDLLGAVLGVDSRAWTAHQDWWLELQLVMYQLQYESPKLDLKKDVTQQLIHLFRQLQGVVGNLHPALQVMIDLHQPNTLVQSGGLVFLYLYGRWHLLVVVDGFIQSIHFMLANGPWRIWSMWSKPPVIKSFQSLGPEFVREVNKKVLPTANDYLVWLGQGMSIIGGPTSDALWRKDAPEEKQEFLNLVQASMEQEKIGVAFGFPV